jgi:hypothetical protein
MNDLNVRSKILKLPEENTSKYRHKPKMISVETTPGIRGRRIKENV